MPIIILQQCCFFVNLPLMKIKLNADALGITTSLACAIHCALLPMFLTSLPLFGINIIHNSFFEAGMILLAFCIGSYSFYHGYRRHHHNSFPFILFSVGIMLLVLKQFFIHYETWLMIPAVLFIIGAHLFNYHFCRVHNHVHPDNCDH